MAGIQIARARFSSELPTWQQIREAAERRGGLPVVLVEAQADRAELAFAAFPDGIVSDFAEADTTTPYYVRYTMTLRSGDGYGVTMQNYLSAWTGDDQAGALAVAQRFPVCQEANFAPDAAAGTTLESCRTYLVDAGDPPIDRVVFDNDTTYDAPEGEISWS